MIDLIARFLAWLVSLFAGRTPPAEAPPAPVTPAPMPDAPASLEAIIAEASELYGIDANIIRAVIQVESGGRADAVSTSGAKGLMQLKDATFAEMAERHGIEGGIFQPRANVMAGTAYLWEQRGKFGSPGMYGAYFLGPTGYARNPSAADDYIARIMAALNGDAPEMRADVQAFMAQLVTRPIDLIVVHYTATPEGRGVTVADVRRWHKQRGWKDAGYHGLISLSGAINVGRPLNQQGAHVLGHNARSIGIAYVGGTDAQGNAKDTRTPAQKAALLALLRAMKAKWPNARIVGHNNLSNTGCPGYDAEKEYANV